MTVQEMERGFQKIWELFAETDRRFKETGEELKKLFKETDKRIWRYYRKMESLCRRAGCACG